MKNFKYKLLVITILALFVWAVAADIPFTFKAGDVISAEQMNQNFIALNTTKQERIIGKCSAGSSVREIAEDGKVICEVDDIGSGSGSAGVDAINGMTGAVILQEGSNIIIDDSTAGQITISANSEGMAYNADDTSLELTETTFSIKDGGVSSAKLADKSVVASKLAFPIDTSGDYGTLGISVRNTTATGAAIGIRGQGGNGVGLSITGPVGVLGESLGGIGVIGGGTSGIGVLGRSNARGIVGTQGSLFMSCAGTYAVGGCAETTGIGVYGKSSSGNGVYGESDGNDAIVGISKSSAHAGIVGVNTTGFAAYFEAGSAVCSFKAGTTGWSCSSDRNLKENFKAVNPVQILESVAHLPVTTWNMKGSAIRQIGPTAQDFYAEFGLGDSDKIINNMDVQGVALAAIQGLYNIVQEQQAKITELERQLAAMQ